jgi:GDP-6-deoxy-D-talose 4-dehydrogenase
VSKVLLTGASGFIGRYLHRQLLVAGHEVVGLANRQLDAELVQCDLLDREHISRIVNEVDPQIIIHSAALSSVTSGDTIDYYKANVVASDNLFRAVQRVDGRRRIVLISTAGVYGNQTETCLTEDLCPLPVSHYGLSKFVCERMLHTMADGHDISILRPFNVIGHGQDESFIVPKLVRHFVARADAIALGNIHTKRDYISVDLCVKSISAILESPQSFGKVVNICSGMGTSVSDLIEILKRVTGHNIRIDTAQNLMRRNEIMTLIGSTRRLHALIPPDKLTEDLESSVTKMLQLQSVQALKPLM